jgi:hypothetical protein
MHINEVSIEHIKQLDSNHLTQLLHSLIRIELSKNSIPGAVFVPIDIDVADGGEDGRAWWSGDLTHTRWLPNKFCLFQNKATDLGPTKCYEEVLEPEVKGQNRQLKSQILEALNNDGCYILFNNRGMNQAQITQRVAKFREAIKDAGNPKHSTFQIEVYDANKIKDWTNENISTIIQVQSFNNISRPSGFQTWGEFEKILPFSKVPYKSNVILDSYRKTIVDSIKKERAIRIIGHSGLGKSRLVLEAFRSIPGDTEIKMLQDQLVYFDASINGDISIVYNYILHHKNQSGIIVIDNCDEINHKQLTQLVSTVPSYKLITIGFTASTDETFYIKIDRDNQRDVVQDIITNKIGSTHSPTDQEYVSRISEGYPLLAINFCDSILKSNLAGFSGIVPRDFIQKLLFSDNSGAPVVTEYKVIRACSIFSSFGFPDDKLRTIIDPKAFSTLEEQLEFIRAKVFDGTLNYKQFYEVCQKYRAKGILEKRGVHYTVRPTILAINLAADWLINTPAAHIIAVVKEIQGKEPSVKFVERLKDLDQIDKAIDLVNELWGPNGSFGSAEVLNTSWGSLLFRYVVEVNPLATSKAIYKAFSNYSTEQLLQVKEGRRNLVWALEKLCFRIESFENGAKVLYQFAAAENETWGNNSTHHFIQLFQVALSGTIVKLNERVEIIKWGLAKNDLTFTKLAIRAMGRGLLNERFTRMSGAEQQGSQMPLQDNVPTEKELFQYWRDLLNMVTEFACNGDENAELAKKQLTASIRTLIMDGFVNEVDASIRKIYSVDQKLWLEAINALKLAVHYNESLSSKDTNTINNLIKDLTPTGVKDELFFKVSKPEWHSLEKNTLGSDVDKQKNQAEEYANYLITNKIAWEAYLPDLLQGEQRQAFNFGKKLGELVENKEIFATKLIEVLQSIPLANQNSELIAGFLIGANKQTLFQRIIDIVISTPGIQQHAFFFVRISKFGYEEIEKLFSLLDKQGFSVGYFRNFQYGRALDNLSFEEVTKLATRLTKYGKSGRWTALSLIHGICFGDKKKYVQYSKILKSIISEENLLIDFDKVGAMDSYYWSSSIIEILNSADESQFAEQISKQIVESCSVKDYNYGFDVDIENILKILIDKYFDSVWGHLASGLTGDYLTCFHLEHLLGGRNGWLGGKRGILFDNEKKYKMILDWCKKSPAIAPRRLAKIIPLAIEENTKIVLHPLFHAIINEFGSDKEVLKALSANMGSFGISGSSIPYYQTQKVLLESIKKHSNPVVREWVENMLNFTEKTIEFEKLREEEGY